VKSGVPLALVVEGSLTAYGERVRMAGFWEFISVMVVGEAPMSITFEFVRDERVSASWRRWPFERSFWFEGGMEVVVARDALRARTVEFEGSVTGIV
jgi:hypothetical protein